MHAKYAHPLPKVDILEALSSQGIQSKTQNLWGVCSPLYNRYRCGSFWHKNLCLKSQAICPIEKTTAVKITFRKETCSRGRRRSVVLRNSVWQLFEDLISPWGMKNVSSWRPDSAPWQGTPCSLFSIAPDSFCGWLPLLSLATSGMGVGGNMSSSFLPRDIGVLGVNGHNLFYLVQCSNYFETITLSET